MTDPIKVKAERMTPEEEAKAAATPTIKVKAKSVDPVPVEEVEHAKRRAFFAGLALALGASVAAGVGFMLWGKRRPRRRKDA